MTDQSQIPRRAIDLAHVTEEDIIDREGDMAPRALHLKAGDELTAQASQSLKTGEAADETLLKSDALLVEGIQQAANEVAPEENSIVSFDASSDDASAAVTAAVASLAGDELTKPIAQAATRIIDAAEDSDEAERSEAD